MTRLEQVTSDSGQRFALVRKVTLRRFHHLKQMALRLRSERDAVFLDRATMALCFEENDHE